MLMGIFDISYKVKSNDGAAHDVKLFLGASSNIAVNPSDQEISAEKVGIFCWLEDNVILVKRRICCERQLESCRRGR